MRSTQSPSQLQESTLTQTKDDNVGAAAWSAVECNTGIICACLPTLKPLIARLFPGMISTFNGSRPTYGDTTRRNSTWNGDGSTIGAPGEEAEYGAGDPERVLALVPGTGFKSPRKPETEEEKKALTQMSSFPETHPHYHSHGPLPHHASHPSDSSESEAFPPLP